MKYTARVSEEDNPFLVRLGSFLQRKREKKGMTQGKVAEIVDISRTAISEIEYGKKDFHVSYLPVFSSVYGFPMQQYFKEEAIRESISKVQAAVQYKIEQIAKREKSRMREPKIIEKKLVARVYEVDGKEYTETLEQQKKAKPSEIKQFMRRYGKYDYVKPFEPDSEEELNSLTEENLLLIERTVIALDLLEEIKDEDRRTALGEKLADYIIDVYASAAKENDEFAKRMCAYITQMGKEHLIRCNLTDFD